MVQEDTSHAQSCMITDLYAHSSNDVTQKKPLNNCLEQAVAERLLLANPAKGCRLPKLEKREMKILPEDKIGPYLAEAERRGLLAAFYLELTTGLRRGELLALLWTDLDVENMTISVSKQVNRLNGELVVSQPKTPSSIRKLAIPQRAVELLVEEHSKHPHSPYLFVSPKTGTMFDPDSFRHTHEKILKAIGAEHIRFHDLRHPYVKPTTKKFASFLKFFRAAAIAARSCSIRYSWLMLPFQISPFLKRPMATTGWLQFSPLKVLL